MAAGKLSHLRGIGPLLRLSTLAAATITLILVGAALPASRTNGNSFFVLTTFPFPVYSLLWCATAILVLYFRGSYHPGIDVGLDLAGWGANWGWCWIVFLTAVFENCDYYYYYYYHRGHDRPSREYVCQQTRVAKGLMYTIGVFMVFYGAVHFALFVMACKATHQRRLRKKRGYMIELDDMEPLGPRKPPSK